MKIAVYGCGAVGAYFGGRLAQAGCDVHFIARGEHLTAIRNNGLIIESIAGDFIVSANATDTPSIIGEVDLVLVCVKGWQVKDIIESMAPLLQSSTMILPLLNGVEAVEELSRAFGRDKVLNGLCGIFAKVKAPGIIEHVGASPWLQFGEQDNTNTTRALELQALFNKAQGFKTMLADNITTAAWMKFIFIATTSAVGSVTRANFGQVLAQKETAALLRAFIGEAISIAKAQNVDLAEDALDNIWQRIMRSESSSDTSMQRDMMAGRPSELESQVGALRRLAQQSNTNAPLTNMLYASLLPQEAMARTN